MGRSSHGHHVETLEQTQNCQFEIYILCLEFSCKFAFNLNAYQHDSDAHSSSFHHKRNAKKVAMCNIFQLIGQIE